MIRIVIMMNILLLPQGPNDRERGLWSLYHIGVVIGDGIWPQFLMAYVALKVLN